MISTLDREETSLIVMDQRFIIDIPDLSKLQEGDFETLWSFCSGIIETEGGFGARFYCKSVQESKAFERYLHINSINHNMVTR